MFSFSKPGSFKKILILTILSLLIVSGFYFWGGKKTKELMQTRVAGADTNLPILPDARGFGIYTAAGSGRHQASPNSKIYKVINLNASGTGSLKACVDASGPRVCVFETSGVIKILSDLKISNPYITIAGQTAPNPGIMIRGAALTVATHDVLVQHIRVRSGDAADGPDKSNRDSLKIVNNTGNAYDTYNVIIDHCSFSWSVDEAVSIWHENLRDVSFLNSIVSEALYLAGHPENDP